MCSYRLLGEKRTNVISFEVGQLAY